MRPNVLNPYAGVEPDNAPLTDAEVQQSMATASLQNRFAGYTVGQTIADATALYVHGLDDPTMSDKLLADMQQNGGVGISPGFYEALERTAPGATDAIKQDIETRLQAACDSAEPTPRRKFF